MYKLVLSLFLFYSIHTVGQKINGVNFVSAKNSGTVNYIAPLDRINANYIALTPFLLMDQDKTNIDYETSSNYFGDFLENMIPVINQAHFTHKKVMMKPHIWVRNIGWAGNLNFSDKEWLEWQENYTSRIIDFAIFAEKHKVASFCIGVELKSAIEHDSNYFFELIESVRSVFSGEIVYASNWDNYFNIPFWSTLDYIGIDCYFPISSANHPSKEELKISWKKRLELMKETSIKHNKKILFTEFGYRSSNKALGKQWEIEYKENIAVNLSLQTLGYQVFFEEVFSKDYIAGGFLWKWYAEDHLFTNFENNDYTPQYKPVEKEIKKWYSKQ